MNISKKVVDLMDLVANEPKKTLKTNILTEMKGFEEDEVEVFKKVITSAYDKKYVYGVKEFQFNPPSEENEIGQLETIFRLLDDLSSGKLRGSEKRDSIQRVSGYLDENGQKILSAILKRDLRMGCGANTFSKVFGKDVISVMPYQRCASFSEKALQKIKFPCISQTKADGRFVNIIVRNGTVQLFSRNGDECTHLIGDDLRNELLHFSAVTEIDFVLHGETLAFDEEKENVLPRDTGNGYLNGDDVNPSRVLFVMWDYLTIEEFFDGKDSLPYEDRLFVLEYLSETLNHPNFGVIEYDVCNDFDDIKESFNKVRRRKEEGLILKNRNAPWKNGTSPDAVKVKVEVEGEVEVVGMNEGKGKFAGMLGSLQTVSSCGEVVTNVAGLTDKQRKEYWNNPEVIMNKIIGVKYNDVTQDTASGKYALYLPRITGIRDDITIADDLERLKEQVDSFVDIFALLG